MASYTRRFPMVAIWLVLVFASISLFSSCVPYQKLMNFQGEDEESALQSQYIQHVDKIKIQMDDILAITVFSTFDTLAAKVFNTRISASQDGSFIGQGYLVDEEGYIEFPILGKIKLEGLTREDAKDTVRQRLLIYLRDPVVDVRFLNLHINVMGEVKRPGMYTFSDERFSILEALTLAGDLTDFADRENLMIIREFDNIREFGIVDLSSPRVFESPYFYLKQNDVIYVKPLKEKARIIQDPFTRALSLAGALSSIATIVVTIALSRK